MLIHTNSSKMNIVMEKGRIAIFAVFFVLSLKAHFGDCFLERIEVSSGNVGLLMEFFDGFDIIIRQCQVESALKERYDNALSTWSDQGITKEIFDFEVRCVQEEIERNKEENVMIIFLVQYVSLWGASTVSAIAAANRKKNLSGKNSDSISDSVGYYKALAHVYIGPIILGPIRPIVPPDDSDALDSVHSKYFDPPFPRVLPPQPPFLTSAPDDPSSGILPYNIQPVPPYAKIFEGLAKSLTNKKSGQGLSVAASTEKEARPGSLNNLKNSFHNYVKIVFTYVTEIRELIANANTLEDFEEGLNKIGPVPASDKILDDFFIKNLFEEKTSGAGYPREDFINKIADNDVVVKSGHYGSKIGGALRNLLWENIKYRVKDNEREAVLKLKNGVPGKKLALSGELNNDDELVFNAELVDE